MNHRSDIDRVLTTWMADGPTAIPDRVVDVVAARIGVQRQRRSWPFPWRTNVTTQIKLIAGLAAALVVAAVGYSLLPGASGPGAPSTAPTASVQPTTAPTPPPSAEAVLPQWYTPSETATGAGILPAGSNETQSFTPRFTFSVPEGWVNDTDDESYFFLFPDSPANRAQFTRSENLAQVILIGVHPTPWFTCESLEDNRGATAAERVAAASANEALSLSDQVEVAIGGLTGIQFDVRRNPDWTGTCPADAELPAGVDPEDERTRVIFLDVPGRGVLGVLLYSMSSADFAAFLAQAMPIVESFEFDLEQ